MQTEQSSAIVVSWKLAPVVGDGNRVRRTPWNELLEPSVQVPSETRYTDEVVLEKPLR